MSNRERWKGRVGNCPLLSTIRTGLTAEWATNLSQECNRQEIEARGTDLRASPHKHTYAGTHICTNTEHRNAHTFEPQGTTASPLQCVRAADNPNSKQLAGRESDWEVGYYCYHHNYYIISLSSSRSLHLGAVRHTAGSNQTIVPGSDLRWM